MMKAQAAKKLNFAQVVTMGVGRGWQGALPFLDFDILHFRITFLEKEVVFLVLNG